MSDNGSPAAPDAPPPPGTGSAARSTAGNAPGAAAPAASARPLRRPGNLRQASAVAKISMVVFAVGLVAILVEVAMVASGVRSLPLWLNLLALLAPIGLLVGLLNTMIRARRERS